MKISTWNENGGGTCLYVSNKEAMQIIKSLSSQVISGNANVGRAEFHADTDCNLKGSGKYLSIFVVSDEEA
jgi:hypothetical protein